MAWNENFPLGSTSVSGSVASDPNSGIRNNWLAIEQWWDIEHKTFTSAGSGTHTAGLFGAMAVGSYSGIRSLTAPGTGAIAYDTTLGEVEIYRPTGWDKLTSQAYSRTRVGFIDHTIPTSAWTPITTAGPMDGAYDTLNEFNDTSGTFTVANDGVYLIKSSIRFPFTGSTDYQKGVAIELNGVLWSKSVGYGYPIRNLDVADILSLVTGDTIKLYGYQESGADLTLVNASLHIIRLS